MTDPNTLPTGHAWATVSDAWTAGYAAGLDAGRRQAEDELAAIQRAAVASVRAAAALPPRDVEADRRRAARSAAYWAERRGEGGAA